MEKKVALITGAAGNLGTAVCRVFDSLGYQVIGTTLPGEAIAEDHKGEVKELNLLEVDGCKQLAGEIAGQYGRLDAAVFCAGGFAMESVESTAWQDIVKMQKLNFETAFHLSSALMQVVDTLDCKCTFVFIGARPALESSMGHAMAPYAMSKAQVIHWSDLINASGQNGTLRSRVVIPGTIDTPQNRESMPDADRSKWVTPNEVANTIAWMCGTDARGISTHVIEMYG
jgi:NAD(P)-dependent dehydrogenase (short-subunit alcohol dehydrogenase family)